jgi:intracellular sulfur oxidation DsrE/DsrF family protein
MASRLDDLLDVYKSEIHDLFTNELVGIYLTGSVTFGEFYEGKSDVDCTVLLKSPLGNDRLAKVKKIHQNISSRYKKTILESQYISIDNIGKNEADTQPFYSYHDNKISLGKHNAHAVTWFTLKKHGITVTGIPASELDITTSVNNIKSFVKGNVNSYWKYWLNMARKPFSQKRLSALTNWGIEWCVCGLTRMYFTMMEGDVTSKAKAVEYGLTCLHESTHRILKEALRIRKCEKGKTYISRFIRRKDMIDYMDYLIELIKNISIE